ncbi:TonB-linked SusC/RagA family outer membrane protein [Ulvibacter antarcticus]|uniref:TonB-linked SusC/RagA family outer membrane protein n=2 Tax=Ulvibacter antarcticus TaxID=442714 RepID=A0A3L9YIF0_9FLAO|nr:TonB-linked SusC/RagA family outer membrane protein [Ulvibacter antarcticus]
MRQNFKLMLVLLAVFFAQTSFAQEKQLSGTVTDGSGVPLLGVNIIIKGTSQGTQTDFDGNYALEASEGQTLVFSYVGYSENEQIVGTSNTLNVTLLEGEALNEVVVTALGISREKRSLGYSTQELQAEDIATNKSGNLTNALSGKVSGLQIKRNTNFGGSTNAVIRGNTSLTGSNQALFVIDGVPINNTNTNSTGQNNASGNYYDYGNAASDINPDDIESINVLKGAAASALYGSRAANGVIMITTKKGQRSKGAGISLNTGVNIGFVDKSTFADYQNQYGAGYGHYYGGPDGYWYDDNINNDGGLVVPYTEDASYGAPFDSNLLVYQWDSFDPDLPNYKTKTPWRAADNGPVDFFETPITLTNSIAFDKSFEEGSFRLSYTKLDQSGLMPNSEINKHNFNLSGVINVTDRLTATGLANYIKTDGLGRNSTGYSDNIISNFKQWWQTNVDIDQQRDAYFSTRRNITWNPGSSDAGSAPIFWDNPYWTRYENFQNDERNRFIGHFSLNYEFADWVNATARVATDTYSEIQEERRAVGSVPTSFGVTRGNVDSGYLRRNISNTETNYDLMLNFNTDISDNINLSGILGTNIRRQEFQSITASTSGGLVVPGLYSLQNSSDPLPNPVERAEKIGVDGIYASASLGFSNTLFIDGTVRRDHSSTLPTDESVYYYPSISSSFVFSKLLNVDAISFGKLRANYAEVGNDAPFDFLYDTYVINADVGTSVANSSKNPNLRSERTKSFEAGLEMKFANSRIGFDAAYYKTNSIDQIVRVPVTTATGSSSKILNAGEIENKGIELSAYFIPIKNDNFNWKLSANWTQNKNEVLSLAEGIETLQLGSFQGGVTINAQVGQPYGVIFGTDYTYLNGQPIIDPANGQYIATGTSNNIIGDTNPDWLMGISNSFNYKNLTFSFLVDIQQGGSIFSLDQYYGQATGLYAETAFTNDLGNPVRNTLADGGGFINEGVNPDGSTNTARIQADRFGAFGYRRGLPNAAFVYDASYVKLREVALQYNLPAKFLSNTFMTGLTFTVTGNNLWIISKDLPHADPESGLSSGNLQGYSTGSLPSTQDYGFNIKAQF